MIYLSGGGGIQTGITPPGTSRYLCFSVFHLLPSSPALAGNYVDDYFNGFLSAGNIITEKRMDSHLTPVVVPQHQSLRPNLGLDLPLLHP